jgi:hypothetical protein
MDFERARRVAVRAMRTAAWKDAIRSEDPTMVSHIPQLTRINKLGMITWNSQAGRNSRYFSNKTGKKELMAERAYCVGFVRADVADAFIEWMWLHTDKCVARMGLADASTDHTVGRIGVTVAQTGKAWETSVSPHFEANDRRCNYPPMIFEWNSTPMHMKARAQIGEYLADPVPETAVAVMLVDMRWGRRANAPKGLFTEIERGLAHVGRLQR